MWSYVIFSVYTNAACAPIHQFWFHFITPSICCHRYGFRRDGRILPILYGLWPMPFTPTKKKHLLPFFRRWKSKIFRCWIFLPRLSANSWSMKPDPSEVSKCAVGLPFAMPSRRGTGINVEFGHVETKKTNGWKPPVLKTEIMITKSSFS